MFPEITLCPDYNGMTHNWDNLCKIYDLCDVKKFNEGQFVPKSPSFSSEDLSNYYLNITYALEDLIVGYGIETSHKNAMDNEK